jgi:hypothetical protein
MNAFERERERKKTMLEEASRRNNHTRNKRNEEMEYLKDEAHWSNCPLLAVMGGMYITCLLALVFIANLTF